MLWLMKHFLLTIQRLLIYDIFKGLNYSLRLELCYICFVLNRIRCDVVTNNWEGKGYHY